MNIHGLVDRMTPRRSRRDKRLIAAAVDACLEPVWLRVNEQLDLLGPAESRGYIRARAFHVVRKQLESLKTADRVRRRVAPTVVDEIIQAVLLRSSRLATVCRAA